MDPVRRNEIKVGIAVLAALIILIGGVMWGKGYSLRTARYSISIIFDNVGGLEAGSNVLANGVVKGRVTSIVLKDGKVLVQASIDKNVTLFSDCRITVESPTVMAGKVVALYPGGQLPMVDVSRPLQGEAPFGMGEAVGMFESMSGDFRTALKNLNTLVVSLNEVAADSANQANIAGILSESHGLARNSNEWVVENRDRLTDILIRLETAITSFEMTLHTTEARLNTTLSSADSAMMEITALSQSLRNVVSKIENGEGTAGKLINDDSLYFRINTALADVDSLVRDIRTKGLRNKIVLF